VRATTSGNRNENNRNENNHAMAAVRIQGRELVIFSKPFKTKKLAENERLKYPYRERRKIGIGVVRVARPVAKN